MTELSIGARRSFGDWLGRFRVTLAYDIIARTPLVLWFVFSGVAFTRHLLAELGRAPQFGAAELMKALAGACGVGFLALFTWALLLRRQPMARATGVFPRVAAFVGTFSLLGLGFLPRAELSLTGSVISFVLICSGHAFACYTLAHLGRSLSIMAEARRLVVTGPYAYARHPLYLGEAIASLGFLLQVLSPAAAALWIVQVSLQLCRMRYEEEVLRRAFPEYGPYAARVARLVPAVF
jgi:protein-S-isoprenylcysteine O-methyltransferase Ste14